MKNFQQTPKQRRAVVAKAKTAFKNSRNGAFQPRAAWENKLTIGGVAAGVIEHKQLAARCFSDLYSRSGY